MPSLKFHKVAAQRLVRHPLGDMLITFGSSTTISWMVQVEYPDGEWPTQQHTSNSLTSARDAYHQIGLLDGWDAEIVDECIHDMAITRPHQYAEKFRLNA